MKNMVLEWVPHMSQFPIDFVISPLIRSGEIAEFKEAIYDLQKYDRVQVVPILVKTPNAQFRNASLHKMTSDLFTISNALIHIKPDIVVCFYLRHAYPLVILKTILGFNLCAYAMGDDVNLSLGTVDRLARKLVYRYSDMILAVSESLKTKIKNAQNRDVHVIPFGADATFFRPLKDKSRLREKWGIDSKDFAIFTVCRLDKRKGVDLLIKSLPKLRRKNVKLIIAGSGEETDSLISLAKECQADQKVSFLGFRTKGELLELYNIADLFVLPSYSEGLPRVLLEAMACECVSIATNVGDVPKVIQDGYNGFMIPSGNLEKLGEKIDFVMSLSNDQTGLIRQKARLTILQNFDNNKLVISIIKKLLDNKQMPNININ